MCPHTCRLLIIDLSARQSDLIVQVLLLDELTTFLEAEDQAAVLQAVRAAVNGPDRVTALWVTHRLEELREADAATFMDNGSVQVGV